MSKNHPAKIRVLLADDSEVVRAGLRALLGAEPGITLVGEPTKNHPLWPTCR